MNRPEPTEVASTLPAGADAFTPRMTVVIICERDVRSIAAVVDALARQTVAKQIELLIMARNPSWVRLPPQTTARFCRTRVVEAGHDRLIGATRAEGIRAAAAPLVAMSEDHCFPDPNWAQVVLEEHDGGADVVGPTMANANPDQPLAWAGHLTAYAPWLSGGGETDMLPGHNSSYRRAAVIEQAGADLDALMSAEVLLHWQLHAAGRRLIHTSRTRCFHGNLTDAPILRATFFHHARNFAGMRVRLWPRSWWGAVALAPLVMALRFKRLWPALKGHVPSTNGVGQVRVMWELLKTLAAGTAGETMGAIFGRGDSPRHDWLVELNRRRWVSGVSLEAPPEWKPYCLPEVRLLRRDRPVRVGVIGCGRLARQVHLPLLGRLRGVEVTRLAEPSEEARAEAQRCAPRARASGDARSVIEADDVDAVLICTPTEHHASQAAEALKAGKHVYLEKPIAAELEDADALIEAWAQSGRVAMVGFNYRRHPQLWALAQALREPDAGRPTLLRTVFAAAPLELENWRRRRRQGGGVLPDFASHDADLVRFLLRDEVVAVRAAVHETESGQSATLEAHTAGGTMWQGFYSSAAVEEARIEVYSATGKWTADRYGRLRLHFRGRSAQGPLAAALRTGLAPRDLWNWWMRLGQPWNDPSFAANLAAFAAAVRGDGLADPDLLDGWKSLAVITAAERSAASGALEPVPESPGRAQALRQVGLQRKSTQEPV